MKPAQLVKPTTTFVDLSKPGNPTGAIKDDSSMDDYNTYGSGRGGLCDEIWDTSIGGSGSYWCGQRPAGGWAEVDASMHAEGERLLPVGMSWNTTAPQLERFNRWADATGAVVRAWHPQSWFLNMFNVSKHDRAAGSLTFDKGGWQGGRVWCRCDQCDYVCPTERKGKPELVSGDWFVENVREELDEGGEWFFNETTRTLYLWPNGTQPGGAAPSTETLVVPRLVTLLRIEGGAQGIEIKNVGFRDAAPSFLDRRWGVPSGGDWALFGGGAVELNNTRGIEISQCNFTRLDANAVYLGGRNDAAVIRDSEFSWIGDSAIALWGESNEWDARQRNYPRTTIVQGNVFRELGIHDKQSTAVFIAKAFGTIIQANLMFNMPRAAININDGAMGGHIIQHNVIFNTCRESGDHGAINSWDRQPFLHSEGTSFTFAPLPIVIQENFITANYGASQGVDNDDGSSFYNIARNVFYLADGFKMDYGGHDSVFEANLVIVRDYDGQNCFNVADFKEGHGDVFRNNTCVINGCRDAGCVDRVSHVAQCNAEIVHLAGNRYYTLHGNASIECGGGVISLTEAQKKKLELGSTAAKLPSDATMLQWAGDMLSGWLPTTARVGGKP